MQYEEQKLVLKNACLLVVDDNDINILVAESILADYGARVLTASSGPKAIELVQTHEIDIVFMDHMMPDMDGVDTTVLIRKLPDDRYKKIPIVALTANVLGDVRDLFIKSGMDDFLAKPLEIPEIERVLCQWLPAEKWEWQER